MHLFWEIYATYAFLSVCFTVDMIYGLAYTYSCKDVNMSDWLTRTSNRLCRLATTSNDEICGLIVILVKAKMKSNFGN